MKWIIEKRTPLFWIGITLFLALSAGLINLKTDFGLRIWFRQNDQAIANLNAFEKEFGNDDNFVVVFHDSKADERGVFKPQTLNLLKELTEELWHVPNVSQVESITNYNWVTGNSEEILIEDFISDDVDLTLRAKQATKDSNLQGYLINSSLDTTFIYGRMKPFIDDPGEYQKVAREIKEIVERKKKEGFIFHLSGSVMANDAYREILASDSLILIPFSLLMIVLLLLYLFRCFEGLFCPLLVIGTTILSTLGFAGHLGIKFNNMLAAIPAILIAIGIADTIHVLTSYLKFRNQKMSKLEALSESIKKNFLPTLLTTITTSIGFLSLGLTDLIPIRDLGLLGGFGTFMAWIYTMTFLPFLLMTYGKGTSSRFTNKHRVSSQRYLDFLEKKRFFICVSFLLLSSLALLIGLKNEVNSSLNGDFTESVPIRKAISFIKKKIGGTAGVEFVFETEKENGIKDPFFLKKVESFQAWLEELPYVNKTSSLVNIIKKMNKTLVGKSELPQRQDIIAEQLFLYTLSLPAGSDIKDQMNLDQSKMRMTLLWNLEDSKTAIERSDFMLDKAQELGLRAKISGKFPLYRSLNKYIVSTFFSSISFAFVLITLIFMIVFKSLKIGLISLFPNILPLVFGAALMQLLGKPIDIGTSFIIAVCLGIAVDDTIYFISHFQRNRMAGKDIRASLDDVFQNSVSSLILTTIVLAISFGVFSLAHFTPNVNFGIFSAFIMVMALVTDLIFLPAFLLCFHKKK